VASIFPLPPPIGVGVGVGVSVIVGVGVIVDVEVEVGAIVVVGVEVNSGPNNCPGPQAAVEVIIMRIPVKSSTESGHAVQWRREATLVREL